MSDEVNKREMSLEDLDKVAGGSKNEENEVVHTVLRAFKDAVQAGQHEAIRANGPLGSADSRSGFLP